MLCVECGTNVNEIDRFCRGCGAPRAKRRKTALLLCVFLGFGVHRFYVGRTGGAVGMLALCVLCCASLGLRFCRGEIGFLAPAVLSGLAWAVWWLTDIARICRGKFFDKDDRPLVKGPTGE